MAFLILVSQEMIVRWTAFLFVILLMIVNVSQGHFGCPDSLVPCLNKTHCVDIEEFCVDYHDCVNEHGQNVCHYCPKDETESLACVTTHDESYPVFECLSPSQICDGTKDCVNNEDENSCGTTKCQSGFWPCTTGRKCIEKTRICDTVHNCPDGSDEGAICHNNLCASDKIHCPTGECIHQSKMCDGISHCSDGYDEQNCTHLTSAIPDSCSPSSNSYTCLSLSSSSSSLIHPTCISKDRFCDGYKDCPMGDDEHECTDKCPLQSMCKSKSDVTCIQHRIVDSLCRCTNKGHRLVTNSSQNQVQSCQDFDECSDSTRMYCSFNCLNTDGDFNCLCPSGFSHDEKRRTCRKIDSDQSKPNLLILFDKNIILYSIFNTGDFYESKLLDTINIEKNQHFDRIQYDSKQHFIIHYDHILKDILCTSSITLKSIILISNVSIHSLAYDENGKTLFIIENQSQTLRMYTPVTCVTPSTINMHSWQLNNITNLIQSIEIDIFNRQIIFASQYEFLISNMSEPNATQVLYRTDREIQRFIYDASFKRLFWTVSNMKNDKQFSVYTCDSNFKQCHDTSIRLTSAWLFAFFNDGLLYSITSEKSLRIIQLYGNDRFSNHLITLTQEHIRSFFLINNQQTEILNLCMKQGTTNCKNQLCLQINATDISCLSIDESITATAVITSTTKSTVKNSPQTLLNSYQISQAAEQRKNYRYSPSNTMLFLFIIIGIFAGVMAFIVKRCHQHLNRKQSSNQRIRNERSMSTEEPNVDEFSMSFNERVSEQRADCVRNVLIDKNTVPLIERRRDSM
ncbi:unnamed protein product [Rotaria socialis]|uniref:EGF-like domain-containing protein n=1 Tax=Rotaria socialis TaxID=392032 RepID=A0A817T775_9BILA|nr:unnamed protein product [Rotaria socialis]